MSDAAFGIKFAAGKDGKVKKPKRVEEGIEYSKWMRFPTCPWCKLEDAGKEVGEQNRPTEIHMLNCTKRPLMEIPLVETMIGRDPDKGILLLAKRPRPGSFVGEALQRQLRYPFRRMIKLPVRNPITKVPTGEFFFFCEYYWKTVEGVADFVWNGTRWMPWFEFSGKAKPVERKEPSQSERNWLGMFFRQNKK